MIDRIKKLCDERGISLTALERELEFGKSTMRKWERNAPSIDKVMRVADYFEVSLDYIIGRSDERTVSVEPNAYELEFLETYSRAKESDKPAVKATLKVLDKLLGKDED